MGRVAPDPANVLKGFDKVNTFGGLKKDDRARIMLFEFGEPKPGEPFGSWAEFIHNLTVPAQVEKRPDGSEVEVRERKWIGTYICLGDPDVVAAEGFDAAGCPCCARAADDESFKPTRRHITNIVRYFTKPGTFDLVEPWSLEVLPYRFNEQTFRKITEIHQRVGDLRRRDLLITCTNGRFQNYEFMPDEKAVWIDPANNQGAADPRPWAQGGLMSYVAEAIKANKADDDTLQQALGAKVGKVTLQEKANLFAQEMAAALGQAGMPAAAAAGPMDTQSIADMLSGNNAPPTTPAVEAAPPPTEPAPAPVPTPAPAVSPAETVAATPPAPAAPPAPAEPMSTRNLDDLLS